MGDSMFDISGKLILITGSGRGLGFALAAGMGQAGARVVLNGRDASRLAEAEKSLRSGGIQACSKRFDVTREREVDQGILEIERENGPVDVLINNAGVIFRQPLVDVELEHWQQVLETNLTGAFLCGRSAARSMIRRRAGKIINICSLLSEAGRDTVGSYAASKGGVKMLTKAMAAEWGRYNIQVNGIGPGYFLTDMTRPLAMDADFDAWLKKSTPMERWGRPEELVGSAIFLASAASNFVTGQIIYVDGGFLASL